jgi:transcriptional regulator GlxA family with amidase domain
MAAMTTPTAHILFFDGFDELDLIGPFEVLSAAGFQVSTVAPPMAALTVRASNGLTVQVDATLDAQTRADLLVVPGGGFWDAGPGVRQLVDEGALPALIARLADAGTVIASVCTGAMLLAAAGLLDGRPAVTNLHALDDLAAAGADVRRDARVVDDGDVVTSGGPLAGIDMAIRLVERWFGDDAGERAAARLEHQRRGPLVVGSQPG